MYNPVHLAVCMAVCLAFFIASSNKFSLCLSDYIALFIFFPKNLCIGVALINAFSNIAAHLWQGYTFFFFPS